jgi:betaine-aldehyde dehydrogenase
MLSIPPNSRDSWITVSAPADGRALGVLPTHSPERVQAVVAGLRESQELWRSLGVVGRANWLTKLRDWLLENADAILEVLATETGKSVSVAHREFRLLLELVPALLAGSAVVVKPSSVTPMTMRTLVTGWTELGAPPVLDFVAGHEAGPAVVDAVDLVHFSGSPETGKVVALRAAARLIPCRLELGGESAAVVLAGADIGRAAAGIALGGLAGSGQSCGSIERVFVESAVYDPFVDRLVDEVDAFGAQDPDDSTVEVMTSGVHVLRVRDQVADAVAQGAAARVGGSGSGHAFEPTVLTDADPAMAVLTQQTLGPVLPVVRVADAEQAIALANDPYSPCASVWTTDQTAGSYVAGRLTAARVALNDVAVHLNPVLHV